MQFSFHLNFKEIGTGICGCLLLNLLLIQVKHMRVMRIDRREKIVQEVSLLKDEPWSLPY